MLAFHAAVLPAGRYTAAARCEPRQRYPDLPFAGTYLSWPCGAAAAREAGDQFGARVDAELGEHRRHVMLDGARRAVQSRGDGGIRLPAQQQLEHLALARRQSERIAARARLRPARARRARRATAGGAAPARRPAPRRAARSAAALRAAALRRRCRASASACSYGQPSRRHASAASRCWPSSSSACGRSIAAIGDARRSAGAARAMRPVRRLATDRRSRSRVRAPAPPPPATASASPRQPGGFGARRGGRREPDAHAEPLHRRAGRLPAAAARRASRDADRAGPARSRASPAPSATACGARAPRPGRRRPAPSGRSAAARMRGGCACAR